MDNTSYLDVVNRFTDYTGSGVAFDRCIGTALVADYVPEWVSPSGPYHRESSDRCEYCGMPMHRCGCGRYR